jgi:dihydrodipicolinate synthase/N-acetylneuraminate lyase
VALLVDSILPFATDGHIDPGAVRAHTLWLIANGMDGLVIGAGEIMHAERRERERVLDVVADTARGRTVLFPIWDPSPAYVVKLGRLAGERGIAGALLPPPMHVPVSEDALVDWYRSVGDHVPAPILAWHHPRFGNALTPRVLARLQGETKIAGWFDSSGDAHRVRRLVDAWPGRGWAAIDEGMTVADVESLAGLTGLAGGVSRVANAWPELARRAWRDREEGLADALVRRALAVDRAGGVAALKRSVAVGARVPLAMVDQTEFDKLPPSTYR